MYLLEQFLKNIYWERFSWEFDSNQKWEWYDLEDFKEYNFWDNIKKINWKMLAKYDKEYVSVYKIEKDPILDIFVDNYTNLDFFSDSVKKYFAILDMIFKNLWIKTNFYAIKNNKLIKIDRLDYVFDYKNKKSNINQILNSDYFLQDNYKLVLSDFIFLDKNINNLKLYPNKIFFLLTPLEKLFKKHSFPTLNWYFDRKLSWDLLEDYEKKIHNLKKYVQMEKIEY